jgi:AraC-like DNA-binding protein
LTHALLSEALAWTGDQTSGNSDEERLRIAADTIRRHPGQFDLHSLADAAMMAPSTFRRKFQHHFGPTLANFAQEERLRQAKRWLAKTTLPIRILSSSLGFSSEFYFMRAFRQSTGSTPGSWRKAVQSKTP